MHSKVPGLIQRHVGLSIPLHEAEKGPAFAGPFCCQLSAVGCQLFEFGVWPGPGFTEGLEASFLFQDVSPPDPGGFRKLLWPRAG